MKPEPIRVLCLDIEGGRGGSSRSLYHLLKHVDPRQAATEVWCRLGGPIVSMYDTIRVPVRVEPWLPKMSALPLFSRNLLALARLGADFFSSRNKRHCMVTEIRNRFDIVHFNHEAFCWLAAWLRGRVDAGFVMHHRTMLAESWLSRMQAKILTQTSDVNLFITKNERENIRGLARWGGGEILHNVVEVSEELPLDKGQGPTKQLMAACLSNYSWVRGTDRLIDLAEALKKMGHTEIRFLVAGDNQLKESLMGSLGKIFQRKRILKDYAASRGVADQFEFLGHISNPQEVLAKSHVLIRPSREDNPWGRDILEAMGIGLPVLACGKSQEFIKPGINGYLYAHGADFDPRAMALDLIRLSRSPNIRKKMGIAARESVRDRCNGQKRARDILEVWKKAAAAGERRRLSRGENFPKNHDHRMSWGDT